jgi:hypothetical protein
MIIIGSLISGIVVIRWLSPIPNEIANLWVALLAFYVLTVKLIIDSVLRDVDERREYWLMTIKRMEWKNGKHKGVITLRKYLERVVK